MLFLVVVVVVVFQSLSSLKFSKLNTGVPVNFEFQIDDG